MFSPGGFYASVLRLRYIHVFFSPVSLLGFCLPHRECMQRYLGSSLLLSLRLCFCLEFFCYCYIIFSSLIVVVLSYLCLMQLLVYIALMCIVFVSYHLFDYWCTVMKVFSFMFSSCSYVCVSLSFLHQSAHVLSPSNAAKSHVILSCVHSLWSDILSSTITYNISFLLLEQLPSFI